MLLLWKLLICSIRICFCRFFSRLVLKWMCCIPFANTVFVFIYEMKNYIVCEMRKCFEWTWKESINTEMKWSVHRHTSMQHSYIFSNWCEVKCAYVCVNKIKTKTSHFFLLRTFNKCIKCALLYVRLLDGIFCFYFCVIER